MSELEFDKELDARNLMCPMPVIKTQQAISELQAGQVLKVVCTDPGVVHDIPAWVRVHGHEILEIVAGIDEIFFLIKVTDS